MRPLIGESQKVMVRVDDRPFLDLLLDYCYAQGLRSAVLLTGYKADLVEEYYQSHPHKMNLDFSKEIEPLGTGGAVLQAKKFISDHPFFVINGDSFCPVNYQAMLADHQQKKSVGTVAVTKVKDTESYGAVSMTEENRISEFHEKTKSAGSGFVNAGVYCFDQNIFAQMPAAKKFSLEKNVFPKLIGQGLYGHVVDEAFFDIGTPERFEKAKAKLIHHQ